MNSTAISPDGKQVIFGLYDGKLELWDITTGKIIRIFNGKPANEILNTDREIIFYYNQSTEIFSVAFSPDGKYVVSGSDDGVIHIWEISTGKLITKFVNYIEEDYISPEGY